MQGELTRRQQMVYDWIIKYMKAQQRPPTCHELAQQFGFANASGALYYLRALEQKGVLKIGTGSRSIRVQTDYCPYCGAKHLEGVKS